MLMLNILNEVGSSLGLEQVEMTLLADVIMTDIRVFRLQSRAEEDFQFYFRGTHETSHLDPITICTIDNRHYNVPL